MIPIAAPLDDVSVHVVQAPGVGLVAPNFGGPLQGRPRLGPVVRLALEVCLLAAELITERSCRRRPRPAGILPLRFRGQPELPLPRQVARGPRHLGQLPAEPFRLRVIDVVNGQVISFAPRRSELSRQLPDHSLPLALGHLVLTHPKAFGQCHLDLVFVRASFWLVPRTAHSKVPWRTPDEIYPGSFAGCATLRSQEGL